MKKTIFSVIAVLTLCGLWMIMQPVDVNAKYISGSSKTIHLSVRKPRYTVIFNANANASEITGEMDDQVFDYGTAQNLTENAYKRTGYGFVNWNTKADGTGATYADKQSVNNLFEEDGAEITLYAQWGSPMPTVFEHTGVCEFNGRVDGVPQEITGDGCEYANQGLTYIDTGVKLYSQENYQKDYEFGFKIIEYVSAENDTQATFVNSKFENGTENSGNPGLVVRKSNDKIEITQMIRTNQKASVQFPAGSVTEVRVVRVDEKIYYSINGGDFVQLQSNVGSTDYHNVPVWFGAAATNQEDGAGSYIPYSDRYLKAKISDMYIKLGDYETLKHTVTFNVNGEGATVSPETKVLLGDSAMGALPVPTRTGHAFEGWYTESEGGTRVREDYPVTSNMTLYAHWSEDTNICEVDVDGNTIRRETLSGCIAAATSGPATITVLADIYENVAISTGQDITFDLGDSVWTNGSGSGKAVIENNGGTVRIINGTLTSAKNDAVINNNTSSSYVYMTGGRIIATGGKQAIYNKGGYVDISGDNTYLSSVSMTRATVQNLSSGRMVIRGGTIESKGFSGVLNESSAQSLIIGEQGNGIQSTPVISGITYGVEARANIEFYDGVLKGVNGAINNQSRIGDRHDGTLTDGTEEINGITYHTLHNE